MRLSDQELNLAAFCGLIVQIQKALASIDHGLVVSVDAERPNGLGIQGWTLLRLRKLGLKSNQQFERPSPAQVRPCRPLFRRPAPFQALRVEQQRKRAVQRAGPAICRGDIAVIAKVARCRGDRLLGGR
jgi:hypothetical protein